MESSAIYCRHHLLLDSPSALIGLLIAVLPSVMHATAPRLVVLAFCLSVLAGYVDALGFISLNGVFVSFMSGNSTRLGVALGTASASDVLMPAGIIGAFLIGVMAGSLVGHQAGGRRIQTVIGLVATGLLTAAAVNSHGSHTLAGALMAASMGALNTTFERDGEVSIAITYMTGNLVKLGQDIAASLVGRSRSRWMRHLLLWVGLTGGACLGAFTYRRIALEGLWIAGAAAASLAIVADRRSVRRVTGGSQPGSVQTPGP